MTTNAKPFSEWTAKDIEQNLALVDTTLKVWGIPACRQMMEKLGFPIPPTDLIVSSEELGNEDVTVSVLHDFFVEIHDSADDSVRVRRLVSEALDVIDGDDSPDATVGKDLEDA